MKILPLDDMIRFFVTFLALATLSCPAALASDFVHSHPDDVLTIFDCDFGKGWDNNYDRWPDNWTRAAGIHFPQFIKAEIDNTSVGKEHPNEKISSLTVDLNGGAFAAYSMPVEASNHYGYQTEVAVLVSDVKVDHAQVSLQFLDKDQQLIREVHSKPIGDTHGKWLRIGIGPVKPNSKEIASVRVCLATLPGQPADLSGKIRFADVWIGRLPRLDLRTEQIPGTPGFGIFEMDQEVTVDCVASGFKSAQPVVQFVLKNIDGEVVRTELVPLKVSQEDVPHKRLGTAKWQPKPPRAGYYQIDASLDNEESLRCRGKTSLAIIESFDWNSDSEFGWSFPHGRGPCSIDQLANLLLRLNSGWVEYPFWYGKSTSDKEIEELLRFIERLSMSGVKLVGLLCDPPPEVRKSFGNPPSLSAAEVFTADPELWYPSLETVMLRLGPRVPYWLLGSNQDDSFVNQDHLQACLAMVTKTVNQTGVDIMIGIPWSWVAKEPTWNTKKPGVPAFLALTADPPMTAKELEEYSQNFLVQTPNEESESSDDTVASNKWQGQLISTQTQSARATQFQTASNETVQLPYRVFLQPLDAEYYPPKVRAADLVQRMLAAKQGGASAILMSDPFSKNSGMINEDGSPDVLLLPWRTTTLNFGGSSYLGSIQLPKGSHNRLFSRGTDVVMAVWSDLPCEECLFLGEDVKIIDIWGRSRKPHMDGNKQVIPVDSTPIFVTGLNPMVTMVRMSVRFANTKLPAVLNREYDNQLVFKNVFPGGITGKVRLQMPEGWEVRPKSISIQLVQDEMLEEPLNIRIPFGALAGKNLVRIDFEVGNRKVYRFSAYRTLQVGSDDLWMEFFPVFDPQGNLTIIQRFVNQTNESVSFRCQLAVPDRQWSESQIVGAGRGAYETKHFFPNAKDLIGKTVRVRAVENNGLQTLNYKFTIE